MSDPRRAARIVADWRRRRDEGGSDPADDLVRAHPDLADDLRVHLALQRDLEGISSPEPTSPPAPLRERIGDFRIVREIGRGGMGVVYEARQESMKRTVALKVLSPAVTLNPKAIERFRREAQAAGSLHHTNIVAVHAMGEADGVWYYAMERIRGRTLAEVIADLKRLGHRPTTTPAPVTPSSGIASGGTGRAYFAGVASAFAGVADALDHAHTAGILHRDVKPSNLMLDADGSLKLTDFGLARVEEDAAGLTMSGDLLGTPAYMSPEQVRPGNVPLDGRTDVYSLGATLYEFLALRPPFRGDSVQDLLAGILARDAVSIRRSNARVPRDLDTIVLKCLEKQPDRRYRTAGDLARDLRLFAEGAAIRARRAGPLGRAVRKVRRHKARTLLVATVIACVGVTGSVLWSRAQDRTREVAARYDDLVARSMERAALSAIAVYESGSFHFKTLDREHREMLDEAIALDPERPAAWYERALLTGRPISERLADLERARALGYEERAYRLARAGILQEAGESVGALAEAQRAEALPAGGGWGEAWLETRNAIRRGDQRAAREALSRLIERAGPDPRVGPVLFVRAGLRERDGDLAGAIEDLAAARPLLSGCSPQLLAHSASLWRRLGQPQRAEAQFQELLARATAVSGRTGWSSAAFGLEVAREWDWLGRAMEAASHAFPDDADFLAIRATARLRSNDLEGARALMGSAAEMWPDSPFVLSKQADVLMAMGDYAGALRSTRRILEFRPQDAPATSVEGLLLVALGQAEEGLDRLRRVAAWEPGNHAAQCNLATALDRLGRDEEADVVLARPNGSDSRCPNCQTIRARRLMNSGRRQEALDLVEQMLRENPRDKELLRGKAMVLRDFGRPSEALAALDEAVRVPPPEPSAIAERAILLGNLGQEGEALAEATRAVELAPSGAAMYVALASVHLDSGRPKKALRAAERALKLRPGDEIALRCRGLALRALGRLEDALACYDEALRARPSDSMVRVLRAQVLVDLGLHEEALRGLDATPLEAPSGVLARLARDPRYRALRDLGRWEDLLAAAREDASHESSDTHVVSVAAAAADALSRYDEAVRLLEEAARRPWPKGYLFLTLADHLAFLGRGDDALRILDEQSRRYPGERIDFQWYRTVVLRRMGKSEAARALAREVVASTHDLPNRFWWLALAGEEAEARALLARAAPQTPLEFYVGASAHALLGDAEPAIRWLTLALPQRWPQLPDPSFDRIRGDPRFAPLERILLGH